MMKLWIATMVFFVFLEFYSVGVMVAAKKCGENYMKCLIPFYAIYVAGKMAKGFSVLTIPVKRFHFMFIELFLIGFFALLYACWGDMNLPKISSDALWQIMAIILVIVIVLMYFSLLLVSRKIYRRFNVKREKLFVLLSVPLITIPFLYWIASKNQPRSLTDMY